jgi:hypothetical protein
MFQREDVFSSGQLFNIVINNRILANSHNINIIDGT